MWVRMCVLILRLDETSSEGLDRTGGMHGWPHRQCVDMEGYDTLMQTAYPELGKIIVPAHPRVTNWDSFE
jgi:hypothetical protein